MRDESEKHLLNQVKYLTDRCGELPFNPTRWWVNSINPDLMVLVEYNRCTEAIEIISVKHKEFKDNI